MKQDVTDFLAEALKRRLESLVSKLCPLGVLKCERSETSEEITVTLDARQEMKRLADQERKAQQEYEKRPDKPKLVVVTKKPTKQEEAAMTKAHLHPSLPLPLSP